FFYFHIDDSEFNKRAFRMLALNTGGGHNDGDTLTFPQFFVSLYNYATLTHDTLVRFAFHVIGDGRPYLTIADITRFVGWCYSDEKRVQATSKT
ncbi:unnamed protein product, partial [Phaeothamnion confervicola]